MTYRLQRLATVHKFGVGMVIEVSNVNETWPSSAWWRPQSNSAFWKCTIVNSATM